MKYVKGLYGHENDSRSKAPKTETEWTSKEKEKWKEQLGKCIARQNSNERIFR